jgi:hypothetical protein
MNRNREVAYPLIARNLPVASSLRKSGSYSSIRGAAKYKKQMTVAVFKYYKPKEQVGTVPNRISISVESITCGLIIGPLLTDTIMNSFL